MRHTDLNRTLNYTSSVTMKTHDEHHSISLQLWVIFKVNRWNDEDDEQPPLSV